MTQKKYDLIQEKDLEKMTEILKAIAHPIRLQIVNILVRGECQVKELVNTLGERESNISQQLRKLKFANILKSRKDVNKVYYSLANDSIKKIIASIIAEI